MLADRFRQLLDSLIVKCLARLIRIRSQLTKRNFHYLVIIMNRQRWNKRIQPFPIVYSYEITSFASSKYTSAPLDRGS